MTGIHQAISMLRLSETLSSWGDLNPTLRSLCGVIEIQHLRCS